jgi:hypothetical protein
MPRLALGRLYPSGGQLASSVQREIGDSGENRPLLASLGACQASGPADTVQDFPPFFSGFGGAGV